MQKAQCKEGGEGKGRSREKPSAHGLLCVGGISCYKAYRDRGVRRLCVAVRTVSSHRY